MKRISESVQIEPIKEKKMAVQQENNVMESLLKDALCIVCLEVPRGIVNQCPLGHILCHSCEAKLKRRHHGATFPCPECRTQFKACRNNFLTKFISLYYRDIPMRCRNEDCDYTALIDRLIIHEGFCVQQQIDCPAAFSHQCHWKGLLSDLANHIKGGNCNVLVAHPPMYMVQNKNELVFTGSLMNREGHNFFESKRIQVLKPIILLNSAIYRMWPFLQIERTYQGKWNLQVMSVLNETSVNEVKVELSIRTADGKSFIARHKMPSVESLCHATAFKRGLFLTLHDHHLRLVEKPKKLFDFQVKIFTNQTFRDQLNHSNIDSNTPLLSDYRNAIFSPLGRPPDKLCHPMVEIVRHLTNAPTPDPEIPEIQQVTPDERTTGAPTTDPLTTYSIVDEIAQNLNNSTTHTVSRLEDGNGYVVTTIQVDDDDDDDDDDTLTGSLEIGNGTTDGTENETEEETEQDSYSDGLTSQ